LKKIAEIFNVTIEELTRGEGIETIKSLIPDEELFTQFQEVAKLDNEEKYAIKILLNAFITKKRMQTVLSGKETG